MSDTILDVFIIQLRSQVSLPHRVHGGSDTHICDPYADTFATVVGSVYEHNDSDLCYESWQNRLPMSVLPSYHIKRYLPKGIRLEM